MLAAGSELTAKDVELLRARFPDHSLRIGDAHLDKAVEFEDDGYEREVARKAQRTVTGCMSEVSTRFAGHTSLDEVSIRGIRHAVQEVISYLQNNPVSAAMLDNIIVGDNYLSARAGNVFYLSMLLGSAAAEYIGAERRRQTTTKDLDSRTALNLTPLGLGAMLIDIGMLPLNHLYDGKEQLTSEAWKQIRLHPIVGAKLLADDFPAAARTIVRTHHENMDGSGYPEGLGSNDLHVFTRIVRIADAFDAATSTSVYKEAKSAVRVLWEISRGPYRRFYDQTLVATLTKLYQPFPIGAKIRLADRRYAVVVKYNRENPLAPQVVVAFDSLSRRLPETEVRHVFTLGERPELRAASFSREDLSYLYEDDAESTNRSHVGVWPSLFEAAYP